jgi:hypothetical protein
MMEERWCWLIYLRFWSLRIRYGSGGRYTSLKPDKHMVELEMVVVDLKT